MRRLCVFALSLLVVGCGLGARRARSTVDAERVARAEALAAKQQAPLAYERFKEARARAARADEKSGERGDHEALARLWLEIAIAESERSELSARRLAEERRMLSLDEQRIALERQRAETAIETERGAARRIAGEELARALAQAAAQPKLRVKLPREDARRAAEAVIVRGELLLEALVMLGQESGELLKLREQLSAARALLSKEPDLSLVRADRALFEALALFGSQRSGESQPEPHEKASLVEALATTGAQVERGDLGLVAGFDGAFRANTLSPEGARGVARLCSLARAYPHGPVQLSVTGPEGALAALRLRALRDAMKQAGCAGARFPFTSRRSAATRLEASFLSY